VAIGRHYTGGKKARHLSHRCPVLKCPVLKWQIPRGEQGPEELNRDRLAKVRPEKDYPCERSGTTFG
jgi:hypothetical protein